MKRSLFALAWAMSLSPALSALEVSALFSDHAVLQRGRQNPIWGWAEPGSEVQLLIADQKAETVADGKGHWRVALPEVAQGGPYTLTIRSGKEEHVAKDVLVGEVWLGSGQSNMAMTVNRANDFEKEQAAAQWPQIRQFTEASGPAKTASERCKGSWKVCSPETVAGFSATAYFFARELHQELKVPVGILNSSVGGTPIESWIDPTRQKEDPKLAEVIRLTQEADKGFDPAQAKAKYEKDKERWKEAVKKARAEGKPLPRPPKDPIAMKERKGNIGGLFLGKIAPLIPYGIRGILWYQGEANSHSERGSLYQTQLSLLIQDWRARWGKELPFACVQLPNYRSNRGEGWMLVRESMLKTVQNLPKTGMAVTIDIGEEKDIHPKNKQEVGRRLSLWALGSVYGQKVAELSGPWPSEATFDGAKVTISFTHAGSGLVLRPVQGKSGFLVAGTDGAWQPAEAQIEGAKVHLLCAAVPEPQQVRYAWEEMPDVTLWNGAGLPGSPFRFKK